MSRISIDQVETSERFYRIPKIFTDEESYYSTMSLDAKFAYGILKDRFELSLKNKWVDDKGDIYLIFTIKELEKILSCKHQKVIKIKKELTTYGLLEEERQGLNKPNRLYVLNVDSTRKYENHTSDKTSKNKEVRKSYFQKYENHTSRDMKIIPQEVRKSASNDTEYSDTDFNDTDFILDDEEVVKEVKEKTEKLNKFIHEEVGSDINFVSPSEMTENDLEDVQKSLDELLSEFGKPDSRIIFDQAFEYTLDNLIDPNAFSTFFRGAIQRRMKIQRISNMKKQAEQKRIKELDAIFEDKPNIFNSAEWNKTTINA